jgi:hypothetical protein
MVRNACILLYCVRNRIDEYGLVQPDDLHFLCMLPHACHDTILCATADHNHIVTRTPVGGLRKWYAAAWCEQA